MPSKLGDTRQEPFEKRFLELQNLLKHCYLKVFEISKNFANFAVGKFAPSEARMFAKKFFGGGVGATPPFVSPPV